MSPTSFSSSSRKSGLPFPCRRLFKNQWPPIDKNDSQIIISLYFVVYFFQELSNELSSTEFLINRDPIQSCFT